MNSKLPRGSNILKKILPINKTNNDEKIGIVIGEMISLVLIFRIDIIFRMVIKLKHNVVRSMAKAAPLMPFNGIRMAIKIDSRPRLIKPILNWVFGFPIAFNI